MPVVRVILREGQEKLYHEAQASIHTPDRTLGRVPLAVAACKANRFGLQTATLFDTVVKPPGLASPCTMK